MRHPLIAAALALALPTASFAAGATGMWKTHANDEGQYLQIEIAPCGDKLCGVIASAHGADGAANADYKHLGRKMIIDMAPDGENAWSDGEIWAPDEDKTYSSNMELKGDVLRVEGCVLFVCRGYDWTRAN